MMYPHEHMKDLDSQFFRRQREGLVERLLEQAASEGVIECPRCGNHLEPDAPNCTCGWENVLWALGFI